jgi:hypothetical protein
MASITLTALLSCVMTPVFARFHEDDAREIDAEERNNTETWNDKNSYRYPRRWTKLWSDVEVGYRSNAGSLNMTRFNFEDDIKIAPRPLDEFTASYTQSRREDFVSSDFESETRLGWSFLPGWRVSILGDSGTWKEYGDMGASLKLFETSDSHLEFLWWSVDHYYDSKKSDPDATRDGPTRSFGADLKWLAGDFALTAKLERDLPLRWRSPMAGWDYTYARDTFTGQVDFSLNSSRHAWLSVDARSKRESKHSLIMMDRSKSMRHLSVISEVGYGLRGADAADYSVAAQWITRRVRYEYTGARETPQAWQETWGPRTVSRDEAGFLWTRHAPLSPRIAAQNGFYVNLVRAREDERDWNTTEVKYQFMLDLTLSPRSFFGVNTTWDVDQITRDWPYSSSAPFRPWGGGNLQFLMAM